MYKDKIVAFIDILGFKKLIYETICGDDPKKREDSIRKVRYTAQNSEGSFNIRGYFHEEYYEKIDFQYSKFSDSILISANASEEGLNTILFDLMRFQLSCAGNGVLMRGGVTLGKIFHEGNDAYGPALIKAYELENKRALYPRIIIDRAAENVAKEDSYATLSKDSDGFQFIDYLSKSDCLEMNEDDAEMIYNYIDGIRYYIKFYKGTDQEFRYNWIKSKL